MEERQGPIRVCVVDDHELIRDGMRSLLSGTDEFEVVGMADTVDTGISVLLAEEPDVALVDARLPDGSGLELIRRVRVRKPHIRCLVVTSFPAVEAFRTAVQSGASGYVSKDVANTVLLDIVRRVGRGGTVLAWAREGEEYPVQPIPDAADLIESLTAQERRILDLIALGRTNREIAGELFLAEKTVRNYVSNLLAKLGLRNRTQAATLLVTSGVRPGKGPS